jgi:hypothetical protein
MRSGSPKLRIGALVTTLVTAGTFFLEPVAANASVVGKAAHAAYLHRVRAATTAPVQVPGVHQVVVNGHCQLVDDHGVPLEDPLYWQRTGHDPC